MRRHRETFYGLALFLGVSGCCLQTVHGALDYPARDAGADAGALPDAGQIPDSGSVPDAGSIPDSGPAPDAGVIPDAGTVPDAGSAPDAGLCIDRASNLDSSATYPSSISYSAASGDLNGDGLLDLVVGQGTLQVFFGLPDGGLTEASNYSGGDGEAIAIGDLDGDGVPDVAISMAPGIGILHNDGNGNLTLVGVLPTLGGDVREIAIADLTGDGVDDILETEFVFGSGNESPVLLFEGEGDGGFSAVATFSDLRATFFGGIAVADLNGDGLPDLVADNAAGTQLAVLLNMGGGAFSTTLYPAPVNSVIAVVPRSSGFPDLVIGLTLNGPLQVLSNQGDGTFVLGPQLPGPGGFFAVGDFNGDCLPDLVGVFFENCEQVSSSISVFYGTVDGGFSAPQSLQASGPAPSGMALLGPVANPRALAIADDCVGGVTVYGDASR